MIGHRNPDTDSVCSAIALAHLRNRLGNMDVRPARAGEIDAETAFVLRHFDVPIPELIGDASGRDLILVDHNEVAQALPHIEASNILEVWEHHRIGDLRLPRPITFHCEPVGATATLIAEQYFAREVAPTRAMAGILIASVLSDTMGFRSPTTTEKDRWVVKRLEPVAEIDAVAFGEEMLRMKAAAAEQRQPRQIVRDDFKEFVLGGERIGIGQIQVMRVDALADRKPDIMGEMRALRDESGLVQVILMITDSSTKSSDLWFVGEQQDRFERAFGALSDGAVRVPGCMSRKQQVVPRLEAAFSRPNEEPSSGADGQRVI